MKYSILTLMVICTTLSWGQKSISGRVFHDVNQNGVYDQGEPVLPHVGISNSVQVVMTDATGQYSLKTIDQKPVFIIQPQGYKTALKEHNIADFYTLVETDKKIGIKNFPLYAQNEEHYNFALLGDIQGDVSDDLYHLENLVVEELVQNKPDLVFPLGDLAFDNLAFFEPLKESLGLIGAPVYYVIGNHDLDFTKKESLQNRDKTFIQSFGPSYYALFYGEQLIFVLNNIVPTTGNEYQGQIDNDQKTFIKNVLSTLANKEQAIQVMMHIPIEFTVDKQEFVSLFDNFKNVFFACGHTHTQYHRYIDRANQPAIHQLVAGAVCGAWWQGPFDVNGTPWAMMYDGTPKGYWNLKGTGNEFTLKYKVSAADTAHQMNIWVPQYKDWDTSALTLNDNYIYANVFAADALTKVDIRFDNGPWQPMQMYNGLDPYFERIITWQKQGRFESLKTSSVVDAKRNSTHLWRFAIPQPLKDKKQVVQVRAYNPKLGLDHIQSKVLWAK